MNGTLKLIHKESGTQLFSVQIDCFTGNCGVKSIDHLYLFNNGAIDQEIWKQRAREMIGIIESFVYHKCNCGLLIGSDTYVPGGKGRTIQLVEEFGNNYHVNPPTWNPNYTWNKGHTIALFWKDLNGSEHRDYWGGPGSLPQKKG